MACARVLQQHQGQPQRHQLQHSRYSDHSGSRCYRRLDDLHRERFGPHAITPHWPSRLRKCTASPVESHLPGLGPFADARVETCVSSLDSGASICFFRDCTDLTPLRTPVTVALADPSVGPVVAHGTTTLLSPAAPSGVFTGYYTPSFSRNLDPSPVLGPLQERYFLIVVDDYSRYTTVFPLRRKADVPTVLEPWLLARGGAQGLCGLRLHSNCGGSPGVAAHFHIKGSLAHVRAPGANKLSPRTRPCVIFGFPLDASGWVFYDPVTYEFFTSRDVTPPQSPWQPPPPPLRPALSGAVAEGEGTGAARAGGVVSGGAGGVGVEVTPVEDTAASSRRPRPASPPGFLSVLQFPPRSSLRPVVAEPVGVLARDTGGPGGVQLQPQQERAEEEPLEQQQGQVPSQQTLEEAEQQRLRVRDLPDPAPAYLWTRRSPLSRAVSQEPRGSRYRVDGPFHLVLRSRVPSPPVRPQPPVSSLTVLHDPLSDYLCASRPVVSRVLSALVTHPTAPQSFVSALVTTIAGFASSHRLDYVAHLVSGPARSPSFGGAPVFPLEVPEDRQFELGFLAAAVPHPSAMLLAPEGDPDFGATYGLHSACCPCVCMRVCMEWYEGMR
ncbi:unnamed protein product [Closterium sp. NIES-53]